MVKKNRRPKKPGPWRPPRQGCTRIIAGLSGLFNINPAKMSGKRKIKNKKVKSKITYQKSKCNKETGK